MKDIDFLPTRYRERTAQCRARVWRALMLCCLAAFVASVALAQQAMRRPIERQLAAIQATYPAAVAATARAEQLQKDLAEIEALAALVTYLRHPWPVTQMLATVTDPLPDSVVVTEITLDRKPTGQLPAPPAGQANEPKGLPAEAARRDLDRLRALRDGLAPTLHVSGVTTDAPNLHRYVSRVAPSPLFKSARIESVEAVASDTGVAGSRFELRLQLRPGFGQPGGPNEPLHAPATTIATRTNQEPVKP
jgi:hypothetical protein